MLVEEMGQEACKANAALSQIIHVTYLLYGDHGHSKNYLALTKEYFNTYENCSYTSAHSFSCRLARLFGRCAVRYGVKIQCSIS